MGNGLLDGFTLFVMLDVVGVVTEPVEELVVVVFVVWFVGCGNGSIAMYIVPWPFVMFSRASHARYSVLFMIVALGTIVNAVV